jgi:hypothetical protein
MEMVKRLRAMNKKEGKGEEIEAEEGGLEDELEGGCDKLRVSIFRGGVTPDPERAIEQFRDADVIVGPHGGGLMNMVYAKPNATVIVFPTRDWVSSPAAFDSYFSHACAALGLRYVVVPEVVTGFYENYTMEAEHIDQIESIVAQALLTASQSCAADGE